MPAAPSSVVEAATEALPLVAVPGVTLGPLLGRGSFGAVYRGAHTSLGVPVAVKVSPSNASRASVDRALAEARMMARLDHPNVLRIYDAGLVDEWLYLVLELMDGGSLEGARRFTGVHLLSVTRQLLSGLQSLHDARIVHRDIKPANCLIRERDGRVKLADLGIAVEQATRLGAPEWAGTLPFMAPELFESPPRFGPRSDLYALGLTLMCVALDEDPFPGEASVAELLRWVQGPAPRLVGARYDLPIELVALIERLVARAPEDRPASASEALTLLEPRPHGVALMATVAGDATNAINAPAVSNPDAASSISVGAWMLGSVVYESDNWRVSAACHRRTGSAARFCHLQPQAPIGRALELIPRSCELASTFDHPGLLAVIDWGVHAARMYVVTETPGRLLEEVIESTGPLLESEALVLVASLADAVAWLHERKMVYQLVQPGSVVFSRQLRSPQLGWPMFCVRSGIAERSPDGMNFRAVIPQHAPPEVFGGASTIEPAVDIYGLGEVLYLALTGLDAFPGDLGECVTAKLQGLNAGAPALNGVTRPTRELLARLLAPAPEQRPSSASEIASRLRLLASRLQRP